MIQAVGNFLKPANSEILKWAAGKGTVGMQLLNAAKEYPGLTVATVGALSGGAIYSGYTASSDKEWTLKGLGKSMFVGAAVASLPYTLPYLRKKENWFFNKTVGNVHRLIGKATVQRLGSLSPKVAHFAKEYPHITRHGSS